MERRSQRAAIVWGATGVLLHLLRVGFLGLRGSTIQRLGVSAIRRLGGSTIRRLRGSAIRPCAVLLHLCFRSPALLNAREGTTHKSWENLKRKWYYQCVITWGWQYKYRCSQVLTVLMSEQYRLGNMVLDIFFWGNVALHWGQPIQAFVFPLLQDAT